MHLESTFKEQSHRLVKFVTFDQRDEKTWPDPTKDNDKDNYNDNDNDKYIQRTPSKSDPWDLWPLRRLIRVMRTAETLPDQQKDKDKDKDNDKDKYI